MLDFYHNPRCSKSRQVMQMLQDRKIQFKVCDYTREGLGKQQLAELMQKWKGDPIHLVRTQSEEYLAFCRNYGSEEMDANHISLFLQQHPHTLQRPILVSAHKAVIGRPPEAVLPFLDNLI